MASHLIRCIFVLISILYHQNAVFVSVFNVYAFAQVFVDRFGRSSVCCMWLLFCCFHRYSICTRNTTNFFFFLIFFGRIRHSTGCFFSPVFRSSNVCSAVSLLSYLHLIKYNLNDTNFCHSLELCVCKPKEVAAVNIFAIDAQSVTNLIKQAI